MNNPLDKIKNKILHDTAAITIITLVSGLALGLVHAITAGPIAIQEAKAKEEAYKAVFEEAGSFQTVFDEQDASVEAALDENGFGGQDIDEAMLAVDENGETLGYAYTVTTHEGYGGDIQFTMGVENDGTMTGISILSISETAGLGMRATTEDFRSQFEGKEADENLVYTKNGASRDNEIDALSGATVTTKAMTNGVNAGLVAYRYHEENGVKIEVPADEENTAETTGPENETALEAEPSEETVSEEDTAEAEDDTEEKEENEG